MASSAGAAALGAVGRLTSAMASNVASAASRGAGAASVSAAVDSVILVSSSSNNVHVTVSDLEGRVVSRASGGMVPGMKHRARSSPQAGSAAAALAVQKALSAGYRIAHLEMKGASRGRGQVLHKIVETGMQIADIRDVSPVPMPGTRPPAARRL
jgi:small subunit ribosomal protein S11